MNVSIHECLVPVLALAKPIQILDVSSRILLTVFIFSFFASESHAGIITLDTFEDTGRGFHDGISGELDGIVDGIGTADASSYVSLSRDDWVARIGMQFDLSSISSASQIQSATIDLVYNLLTNDPIIEIHGFTGTGSIRLTDVYVDNLLGTLQTPTSTELDVTPFIRDLVQSNKQFAGISIRIADDYSPQGVVRQAWTATKFDTRPTNPGPRLNITTVPEPSTLVMWSVLGGIGLSSGCRRRKKLSRL